MKPSYQDREAYKAWEKEQTVLHNRIQAGAKELQRRRDNPTQAEWDADNRDRFESIQAKADRTFRELDLLIFARKVKKIEERTIARFEELAAIAINEINS